MAKATAVTLAAVVFVSVALKPAAVAAEALVKRVSNAHGHAC